MRKVEPVVVRVPIGCLSPPVVPIGCLADSRSFLNAEDARRMHSSARHLRSTDGMEGGGQLKKVARYFGGI